ncbi:hypothetical protein FACS189494_12120 [Spirochaetia bacterium]|nr:hypothetical protein FACS189494_12120 [Spirochaetia bacterium]
MDNNFYRILKLLLTHYGNTLFDDRLKLKSLLQDYAQGEFEKEVRLFMQAVEINCHTKILQSDNIPLTASALIQNLQDNHYLTGEAAHDVVSLLCELLRNYKLPEMEKSNDSTSTVIQNTKQGVIMEEYKIRKSLERIKDGLEQYLEIMELFPNVNVSTNKSFQSRYTGFYKMRHNNVKFYDAYYLFMENHKNNIPSFTETLIYLYQFGRLEASFSSKLLATINPNLPVWDQFILNHFNLEKPPTNLSNDTRIIQANNVYEAIIQKYKTFLASDESKTWIKLFDEYYPNCKITPIKKIDLILWQARD